MTSLYTTGYGAWKTSQRLEGLIAGLKRAGVTTLVDTRHSPCASTTNPDSLYGPKEWNLQAAGGVSAALAASGIKYLWLVELGNPQKNDPGMQIMNWQLADPSGNWPVHRGLELLASLVRIPGETCCLLCACEKYHECHRRLVAEALRERHFDGELQLANIGARSIEVLE